MNFKQWWKTFAINDRYYSYRDTEEAAEQAWNACKEEVLKIIKSKYPKEINDLVYEDGWDTACMSIEEEIENL